MAMLTVRNVPDKVRHALRIRAALHGRSMEAEVRQILEDTVAPRPEPVGGCLDGCATDRNAVSLRR